MEIVYKAWDGKIFTDKDECLAHEEDSRHWENDIKCFTESGEPIPFLSSERSTIAHKAYFIWFASNSAIQFLIMHLRKDKSLEENDGFDFSQWRDELGVGLNVWVDDGFDGGWMQIPLHKILPHISI